MAYTVPPSYIALASVPALSCRSGIANEIYCKALSYIIRIYTQHASQWIFSIVYLTVS